MRSIKRIVLAIFRVNPILVGLMLWIAVASMYFSWQNPALNGMQFWKNWKSAMMFEGKLDE